MKFIRKFLVFILSWLLVNIIGLFCLSICLKNIIQHELLGNLVKENVVPTINETLNETVGNQNYDISDIKVLLESEEMNDVLDMIVDEVIANLSSDENAKSDILDKMIDYLIENKEKIERETGKKLDLSGIDKFRNSEEYKTLNEAINETISETSSGFSANDKKIIRTYSFTVSNNFRLILIGCFIATLCLIALLQWSFYKWIGTLGSSCLVSGVTLVVLHFVSKLLITSLLSSMSTNVTVDVSSLLYFGISCIVLAIVLYIVKKILSKIFGNRSDKLDTSEASA